MVCCPEVSQVMFVSMPTSVHNLSPFIQHLPSCVSSYGDLLSQAKRARLSSSLVWSCHTDLAPLDFAFLPPVLQGPHVGGEGSAISLDWNLAVRLVIAPPLFKCNCCLPKVVLLGGVDLHLCLVNEGRHQFP